MLLPIFVGSSGFVLYNVLLTKHERDTLVEHGSLPDGTMLTTVNNVKTVLDIRRIKEVQKPPTYISRGKDKQVLIPVDNGTRTEKKIVLTLAKLGEPDEDDEQIQQPAEILDGKKTLVNWDIIDLDSGVPVEKYYLNSGRDIKEIARKFNISHNSIPAYFPLKVREMSPPQTFMWSSNRHKVLGCNRLDVAKFVASQRNLRTPQFAVACITAGISGVFWWASSL